MRVNYQRQTPYLFTGLKPAAKLPFTLTCLTLHFFNRRWAAIIALTALILLTSVYPLYSQTNPVIRVGVYNFEPLIFIDEAGQPQGIYLEVLADIAAKEGWQLEYVPCAWADCLAGLEKGDLDILPSIGYTEERAQKLDFTSEYLFLDWGEVYRQKGGTIDTVLDLDGKRVAALKGSIYTEGFRKLLQQFDLQTEIIEKNEYTEVLAAVDRGEVDAGIITKLYGAVLEDNYQQIEPTYIYFSPTKIYFALPKGKHPQLLATLNQYFAAFKADKNSAYYQSLNKWMEVYQKKETLPFWLRWALIIIMGVLALFLVFTLALRRQVAEKTRSLVAVNTALQQSQEQYRALVENINGVIFTVDTQSHFTYISPVIEQLTTYRQDEIIGQEFSRFVYPDDLPGLSANWEQVLTGQSEPYEFRILDKDGRLFYVRTHSRLVATNGRPPEVTGILTDITSRKQAEEALRESNEYLEKALAELKTTQVKMVQQERLAAVGQLAAGIAHDFNNILTGILGFAGLLQLSADLTEEMRDDLAHIVTSGQRAAHLVRQILDFSRKSIRRPQQLDLKPFVKEVCKFLERTIPENIHLNLQIEPGGYLLNADPTQMQQMLANLVVNARDAMPDGGELQVRLFRASLQGVVSSIDSRQTIFGDWLGLTVKDTGSGIPVEVMPHIFEPFFTTKGVGEGSGLGLAQVLGIVQQHEGHLTVESQPDQGATFTVYLPPLEQVLPAPEEAPALRSGQGETILLVEDDPIVLKVNKTMLQNLGYHPLTATNGREALALYAEHEAEIALVLSDMVMPDMDGVALFNQLKAQHPAIRMVMMSGYPLAEKGAKLLEQGLVAWFQKPISFEDFSQIINKALSR